MYRAIKNTGKYDAYINAVFTLANKSHQTLSDFKPEMYAIIHTEFAEHLLATMREDVEAIEDEAWADSVVKEGIVRPYTPYAPNFPQEALDKGTKEESTEGVKKGPGRPPKEDK